jgi:hypothetical protein
VRLTDFGLTAAGRVATRTCRTTHTRAARRSCYPKDLPIERPGCWSPPVAGFPQSHSIPTRPPHRDSCVAGVVLPAGPAQWPCPTSMRGCRRRRGQAGSGSDRSPIGEARPPMVCHRRVVASAPPHQTTSTRCLPLSLRSQSVATTSPQPRSSTPSPVIQLTDGCPHHSLTRTSFS